MKTPEEIRDVVLAECDRHGLDFCYQCQIENGVLHRKRNGRYRLKIGNIDLHLDDDSPLVDFQSAYRILGLAGRDAVAEKDAEIEGLRRAFNNNMDDMLVVVNEVKRLLEGITEIKSKIGEMTCDAVTFEAVHGIFCDLRKLLADSPAPVTEAPKPLTIEEMREYCVAWCEATLTESDQYWGAIENIYIRRYEKTKDHPRYWVMVFGIVLWPTERKHDGHHVASAYSIIRAIERGDLGQGKEGGV